MDYFLKKYFFNQLNEHGVNRNLLRVFGFIKTRHLSAAMKTLQLVKDLTSLPVASPVLIQSGLAMLAIAKISAARNRHPEMMVSLSISSASEAVREAGKWSKL